MVRSRRQLTAVMFTDVVGYSAMVQADERAALALLEFHRRLLRAQVKRFGGSVVDAAGDGHLVTFGSALAAVECAIAVQDELARRNAGEPAAAPLRLRIGLHQGDVERSGARVSGDGVNVGARLEPLAPHGGIAASAMVVGQIHGPLRAHFRSVGPQALKNIAEPIEVFALEEPALAAAATLVDARRYRRAGLGRWLAAAAVILALAAAGAVLYVRDHALVDDASLAVLPLENLSTEPGSSEFAGGLHDSLLTEVSRLPELRVISRGSVMQYAGARPPSPELGRALGVAHLLEGSVQRVGARVRVNVQLIRARTDEHLWAEIYDRDLDDLFELQTDISREVARKIRGSVVFAALPRARRPTRSIEAYDLYLRAIAGESNDLALGFEAPTEPLRLLERAVTLDPGFALAHAALARYAVWGASWATYLDPAKVADYASRALTAAARAMELAPESAEALHAMGLARYWKEQNPAVAVDFLVRALRVRPGFDKALYQLSGAYAQLGDLPRSLMQIRALLDVDPHNDKAHEQHSTLLMRLRRYAEADEALARWQSVSSTRRFVSHMRAQLEFRRSGDLGPWQALTRQPADGNVPQDVVDTDRWFVAIYEGRFADAAAINRPLADDFVAGRGAGETYKWAFGVGQALAMGGETQAARPYLQAALTYLQRALQERPDEAYLNSLVSQLHMWLGDAAAAQDHAHRAVERAAPRGGAVGSGQYYEVLLSSAQVAAHFGRADEALALLERLLREPSGVHAHVVLRDPQWAPLDRDPAFQALVRRHLPAAS